MEQAWVLERLAVTVARIDFVDPAPTEEHDARERGVRVEVRLVDTSSDGSVYVSPEVNLRPAVCRIDLLESAPYAADRMHWHPVMTAGEPGDRRFDPVLVADPLTWLADHVRDLEPLLTRAGVPVDDKMRADVEALRAVVPAITAAAEQGLAWARTDPWPMVERDGRGMARRSP